MAEKNSPPYLESVSYLLLPTKYDACAVGNNIKHTDKQEEIMQKFDYQKKRRTALPEYISVISSNKCAKIKIDDIEVIEQDGRKVHLITAARDYSFYGSINAIVGSLAERAFYRPIRRLVINLDHVSDISSCGISFSSGQSVTLGKNALLSTRRAYKKYLLRYPPYTIWEPVTLSASSVSEPYAEEDNVFQNKIKTDEKTH